jgi:peptidoglycan/LPS O-acetylase OafA/YrhL
VPIERTPTDVDASSATDPDGDAAGSPATSVEQPREAVRIPHAPGLDGLRGLAVLAVVVFHAGPPTWLPAGFLGVSLFFTLSGYLITTLVLAEVRRDRDVDLKAFWARRMRRLVPALVVLSLLVLVMSWVVDLRRGVRDDLLGGLTYTANWVQVWKGQSYGDLFLAPSPLVHLWSLAIEEQFYLVLPVVAWVFARWAPWETRRNLGILAGLSVVAGFAALAVTEDPTVAYYSTLHRAPEIGVGVLLACLTQVRTDRSPRWLTALGFSALAAAAALARFGAYTDPWVSNGGLIAFALLSAALVRTSSRPGPVATFFSFAPLRWLGLISYGLYLYHWPIVVLLDRPRVAWDPVPLFVARAALSLLLAVVSYKLLEQPIRHGFRTVPDGQVIGAGLVAITVCVVLVLVGTPPDEDVTPEAVAAPAVVSPLSTELGGEVGPLGPPVVAIFGDSVPAWMIRDGGSGLDPDEIALIDATLPACDGAEGTPVARSRTGAEVPVPAECTGWRTQYPPALPEAVDTAVLMVGVHAALDRDIEGEFRGPCDPVAAAWYQADIEGRIDFLADNADTTIVVLPTWADDLSAWILPADQRERLDCVRATLEAAAEAEGVPTIDFADYVCPDGPYACLPLRTRDGMHIDPDKAPAAVTWLQDEILATTAAAN